MTKARHFVGKWADKEILTGTAPADRSYLKKFVEEYDQLETEIERIHEETRQNDLITLQLTNIVVDKKKALKMKLEKALFALSAECKCGGGLDHAPLCSPCQTIKEINNVCG